MKHGRVASTKPRKGERAVSPALSTVMLTGAIVVMLLVVVTFANSYLNAQIAQNEFGAMEQFMQTIGLQTDYVAWINGQTQTTRFASRFGFVSLYPVFLNYSVYLGPSFNFSYLTRVLLFNMPISSYNIANGHYEQIIPTSSSSFLQTGTSAVVARVFVIEKLPMTDGSYVRIVVAPCIRAMNSTVSTSPSTQTNYTKLYLPLLVAGSQQGNSQSVTLVGTGVIRNSTQVTNPVVVSVSVSFPNQTLGFDRDFFRFSNLTETVGVFPGSTIIEFYTGKVTVSLGLYG